MTPVEEQAPHRQTEHHRSASQTDRQSATAVPHRQSDRAPPQCLMDRYFLHQASQPSLLSNESHQQPQQHTPLSVFLNAQENPHLEGLPCATSSHPAVTLWHLLLEQMVTQMGLLSPSCARHTVIHPGFMTPTCQACQNHLNSLHPPQEFL